MKKYLLECCVDSVESAIAAQTGGADRLELCSNLIIGGTTPTLALYHAVRKSCSLPIHVLIRPRFGDFLYTEHEAQIIASEIEAFRDAKADGVVIGSLCEDGTLHLEQMKRFISAAGDMSVTLHRAFDMCKDPFLTLEQAMDLGVHTILTSGQASDCLSGMNMLQKLISVADDKIQILAGSGINASAVKTLLENTGLTQFHMSGKKVLESAMTYRNPHVSMGLPGFSEYEIWRTDALEISRVRSLLDATP